LYVIQTENRADLIAALEKVGIGSQIHYPTPVHLQGIFKGLGNKVGDFPIAEKLSNTVLSLPFFIGLTEAEQSEVVEVIRVWAV
jgi:dTDP-4-amino-4,6-dideoxygalactose transaminase